MLPRRSGCDGALMTSHFVQANGIAINYVEAGTGEPLVLVENGMISTNPIWAPWLSSYAGYVETFAQHFRVIVPDLRGSGRTVHPGGPIPYALLADDLVALMSALQLDQPLVCGYGEGGAIATIAAIRHPASVRAVVNHAGCMFDPDPMAPALTMTRQMLGGSPDAVHADPDMVENSEFLGFMVELMKADHDAAQGTGHWRTVLEQTFQRVSQPSGCTFDDLRGVVAPTLILVGDRDRFGTVEEGSVAYRALPNGELAVLPNDPGGINATGVETTIAFLERHRR